MIRSIVIVLFFGVVLSACLEELEDVDKAKIGTLNPDVALPLVSSEFTMEEFLIEGESNASVSEENGVILLTYQDTVKTQGTSFVQLKDQTSPQLTISGTEMSAIPAGQTATFDRSATLTFDTDGDELDSIQLSAGDLITALDINAPVSGSVVLTFTSVEKDEQPIVQTLDWTFDGTNSSQQLSQNGDLANSTIILTDGSTTNKVSFNAQISITNEGSAISPTDEVAISFGLSNMDFKAIFGKIIKRSIQTPQRSVSIDIFNNINQATFSLDDPRLKVDFVNSFGLPAALRLDQIAARAKDGSIISLDGNVITNESPVNLEGPSIDELGLTKTTTIEVNNENSNLPDILNSLPSEITYTFPGEINPSNEPGNFVLSDSKIEIFVRVDLPLSGTISNLVLDKSFDFDGNGIDELDQATLILNSVNTFPIDGRLQVYFLDDNFNTLDSLYDDNFGLLMKAADVDNQGLAIGPGEVNDEVVLEPDEIDRIDQATHLTMRVLLQTTNTGTVPIKISPSNSLQVNMGLKSKLELN